MVLNSCKPSIEEPTKECSKIEGVFLPKDAANRFVFDSLSYWVYSNSPLGLDIYAISSFHDTMQIFNGDEYTNRCYEYKSMVFESNTSLMKYEASVSPISHKIKVKDEFKPYSDMHFHLRFTKFSNGFYTDMIILKGNTYLTPFTTSMELIDSIEINNNVYQDILKLEIIEQESGFFKEAFWARDIGLVSYTDLNNVKWNITSYKITK